MKLTDAPPIIKKKDPFNKENDWPVSLLSHFLKVFERLWYKQIEDYITEKILNYSLIYIMLEKWENWIDKDKDAELLFGSHKSFWCNESWSSDS